MRIQGLPVWTASLALGAASALAAHAAAQGLATAPVTRSDAPAGMAYEAVVEAVRHTEVAAQVAGAVTEIRVKAGDRVRAGQVLVRLDARAAELAAASGDAQLQAAEAALDLARRDLERKQQLLQKNYISQAAFERAQAQFQATQAQVAAQRAQARAAHTQSGFFVVEAPYPGMVTDVPVALGDMALPGKPLVALYDPEHLRVTATVPQTELGNATDTGIKVEIPGMPGAQRWFIPTHVQVLPTVDPATHTREVRLDLPARNAAIAPGMFARAWLGAGGRTGADSPGEARLFVPAQAVLRRAEVTAVYVVDDAGRPALRQVRLGERRDDHVEVLSGVSARERVALDPQAAARAR